MAIGLGRTISSPVFLFFQVLHGVSLFFVMLGVTRVLLGMAELSMSTTAVEDRTTPQGLHRPDGLGEIAYQHTNMLDLFMDDTLSSTTTTLAPAPPAAPLSFFEKLSYCFHVPLASLFVSTVDVRAGTTVEVQDLRPRDAVAADGVVKKDVRLSVADAPAAGQPREGSECRFYLQHMFAALLCSYPLATLLQRRKLVLDFVVTIYLAYWLLADIVLRRLLGGGLHWWAACALGMTVMYGATYVICQRKELQEIRFSGGGTAGSGAGVPATTTMWLKDCRGEDDIVGEEMRVISRETQRHNGSGGADAHGSSKPHDAAGRSRVPASTQSSNGAKAVAVDVSRASEEATYKHKMV
ncbi:conserved hypothetical protein [Leishmania major strain Friedlin]|uniref:Integral membrane protein n=1 Tax=Leishmania major TaxID=5664 RepID=E9AE23_LEIMA|nr:conserved hypothetical protein [Leishmania major strain Friedlin]CAG9577902.1 Integral_membrane_protein_S_linking_to_the_trans_Golgi_network_-_putative [Leishmania major strain Friedlin]CBZ12502.1 conserved hypothetical protein [Leishmania major strain Friedlin]|eukprot:XP_003722244.1 conserved hypothetical protein [Leishmania major strain Friedlin]